MKLEPLIEQAGKYYRYQVDVIIDGSGNVSTDFPWPDGTEMEGDYRQEVQGLLDSPSDYFGDPEETVTLKSTAKMIAIISPGLYPDEEGNPGGASAEGTILSRKPISEEAIKMINNETYELAKQWSEIAMQMRDGLL